MITQEKLIDDELDRLNIEWVVYNALREGVGLSLRDIGLASHRDTLRLAQRVEPKLFAVSDSLLVREWESPEEREVRDISIAQGITFEVALDAEITRLEALVEGNKNKNERLETLNRRLVRLKTIKTEITQREYYEGKLIERDARIGNGDSAEDKKSDNYFDFALPAGRFMRIRIVHETKVEPINGADLIYEHHDLVSGRVRIAAVQYKILRDERYVRKSDQLKAQLTRLEDCFCKALPCKINNDPENLVYRLPTCVAFLRPTYKLQSTKSSVLSRGFYLPVCAVQTLWKSSSEISEESANRQVVRQAMFEDLFNANLLGSRWLTVQELDTIYKSQKILEPFETSLVHVKVYNR